MWQGMRQASENMPCDYIVRILVHRVISLQALAPNQVLSRHKIHDAEFPGVPNAE
jgi:hypothetical protein